MTHDELAGIIGPLALRLTQKQVDELEHLARTNPTGLAKMIANVEADPSVDSVIGTALSRARRGDIPTAPRRRARQAGDPRQWARKLYDAKINDLLRHDLDWTEAEKREHAIDYALDHCRASGDQLRSIEAELRAEHEPERSTRDFERDTEHRRRMIEAYGPGKPLPGSDNVRETGLLPQTPPDRRCRSGAKCVIAVAGGGATLSRVQTGTTYSDYCIPCTIERAQRANRTPRLHVVDDARVVIGEAAPPPPAALDDDIIPGEPEPLTTTRSDA